MRISDWSSDVCSSDLQQRRRPEGMPADSEQRARATTIEQHPQRRDIAGGADLLVPDDDPRDESVERRIGKRPRMSRPPLRQHMPRLALLQSPAALARVLSGLGTTLVMTVGALHLYLPFDTGHTSIPPHLPTPPPS